MHDKEMIAVLKTNSCFYYYTSKSTYKVHKLFLYWQKLKTIQLVRKSQASVPIPAGWATERQREYLQRRTPDLQYFWLSI